jgi:hypothetical protein
MGRAGLGVAQVGGLSLRSLLQGGPSARQQVWKPALRQRLQVGFRAKREACQPALRRQRVISVFYSFSLFFILSLYLYRLEGLFGGRRGRIKNKEKE